MTNAELQALELQARIMGWAPATEWDCIVDVPGPGIVPAVRPAHLAQSVSTTAEPPERHGT